MKKIQLLFSIFTAIFLLSNNSCQPGHGKIISHSTCSEEYSTPCLDQICDGDWISEKINNQTLPILGVWKSYNDIGELFYIFGYGQENIVDYSFYVYDCNGNEPFNGEVEQQLSEEDESGEEYLLYKHLQTGARFYPTLKIWGN